jgi:surface polysaccharide O-acyltransferase-like enzyme
MMVISYTQGQKHYPIPYPKKKLLAYLGISVILYVVHELIASQLNDGWKGYNYVYYGSGVLFMVLFAILIVRVESKELQRLPVIGRYFYRAA